MRVARNGCLPTEVVRQVGPRSNDSHSTHLKVPRHCSVGMTVVEHRNRLCRSGFEYVEPALSARGCRVYVADETELEDAPYRVTGRLWSGM